MSRTFAKDFLIEVRKGNIPGHSLVHKFGRNDSVPNGSWEFINLLGFTSWPLSAATTVRVKAGGNAADDTAGNGAREITIQGIDSNLVEISEAVATAGAAASSATAASFWRVHKAWVSSSGTYGASNTAAVTIENSGGGTDLIQINTEEGQTQFGGWSVPTGKTAFLLTAFMSTDSSKAADFRMFIRESFNDTTAPMKAKRVQLYFDGVISQHEFNPNSPGASIPALTDIWWEAEGGGAITEVSIDFELLVVDN